MVKKKYTIKDIALMAGVSKGTVDRVLHKRGKVSKNAFEKIDKILKQTDYQPNPVARSLKNNKTYRIGVLIPDFKIDPYWEWAHKGISDAEKEFKPFGISIEKYVYNPKEKASFIKNSKEVMAAAPDAVLMTPVFQEESLSTLRALEGKKIKVALFNNHLPSFKGNIFIGQDLYKSGRVAGNLIAKMTHENQKIIIAHLGKEPHMQLKEDGFKSYLERERKDHTLLESKDFNMDDHAQFERDAISYFSENPNISAIFVTNSKAYVLVSVLRKIGYKALVVGYDLLNNNVAYLKEGAIDFLIHQKPARQAYLGIAYFAEFFLFEKRIPPQKLLPIDIINAENVDDYLS